MKLTLIFVLLVIANCSEGPVQSFSEPMPTPDEMARLEKACALHVQEHCLESRYLLSVINQERLKFSLKALMADSALDGIAKNWACQLNKSEKFDHGAWSQRQLSTGFQAVGQNLLRLDGEDVNLERLGRVAYLWRQSPPHYKQWIRPKTTHIGTGICVKKDITTFVQEFTSF